MHQIIPGVSVTHAGFVTFLLAYSFRWPLRSDQSLNIVAQARRVASTPIERCAECRTGAGR